MSGPANETDIAWTKLAQQFVAALAATNKQFTVDEVHRMLTEHGDGLEHSNPKAMGAVMQHMVKRSKVIDPQPIWQTSCRNIDRPIRVFMGTDTVDPTFDVSEDQLVWAIEAIEHVARVRAQQMRQHLQNLRAGA